MGASILAKNGPDCKSGKRGFGKCCEGLGGLGRGYGWEGAAAAKTWHLAAFANNGGDLVGSSPAIGLG